MKPHADRVPRLDNAKGALILMVIWGHLIEPAAFADSGAAAVYSAIYLFHMPAFAMLGGMVARPGPILPAIRRVATTLLLPLVVFQLLYWPFLWAFAPGRVGGALTPHWFLWYLASLAAWRLMLPLFTGMSGPVSILVAVTLAVAAGFMAEVDRTLSLSRTFVFFPAYLVGYRIAETSPGLTLPASRTARIAFVIACLGAAGAGFSGWDFTWLYGSDPYVVRDTPQVHAALTRLVVVALGILTAILFVAALPLRPGVLTSLGRLTLPVYLLHGFLVVPFWMLVPPVLSGSTFAHLAACAIAAIVTGYGIAGAVIAFRSPPASPTAG